MLVNNQPQSSQFRHNYLHLGLILSTLVLFIVNVVANEYWIHNIYNGSNNVSISAENGVANDINPSFWLHRSLNGFNYLWQISWLLYSLTFIFRRSSIGYLYMSPNTLTARFFITYIIAFVIPTVWLLWFQKQFLMWTWIIYLVSFLLLSLGLFIINNNLAVNKKIYETEGFDIDVWLLRFFAQNGVAFFASCQAVRLALAFDIFLQLKYGLSISNAGTVSLILAGVIAFGYFFGPNINAALVEQCAYQFSPWVVFIFFFWAVVENNWDMKHISRNSIIAAVELLASFISAIVALALFSMRYRASKIDHLP